MLTTSPSHSSTGHVLRAPAAGSIAALGMFDGVHLGHRRLLAAARRLATRAGLATTVVTFDRHPAVTLRPAAAPPQLMTLRQKLEAFASLGYIDEVVVVPFDRARSEQTAESFVREILVEGLLARGVVVGQHFRFGAGRQGDVALLRAMGEQQGFDVLDAPLLVAPATMRPCSSTSVREMVSRGDLRAARSLLGRPLEIECEALGAVGGHGNRLELRAPERQCLPPPGTYDARLRTSQERASAVGRLDVWGTADDDGRDLLTATLEAGPVPRGTGVKVALRARIDAPGGDRPIAAAALHSR